jgi:hypothetical protein
MTQQNDRIMEMKTASEMIREQALAAIVEAAYKFQCNRHINRESHFIAEVNTILREMDSVRDRYMDALQKQVLDFNQTAMKTSVNSTSKL